MNISETLGRVLHTVRWAARSSAVIGAGLLLLSCGGSDNPGGERDTLPMLSRPLAMFEPCSDVATIAAGTYHTLGLKADGSVVAVGDNSEGQLSVSSWRDIKAIAAGAYFSVGLEADGTVVAVGHNGSGQRNISGWMDIKAIAAGSNHTVGLKQDGTVVAAGSNVYGQLKVSSWTKIKAIAAGAYHSVGLQEDGAVVAVGSYGSGQLKVTAWRKIKAIAAGAYHTVGLREDGTVVATGANSFGQTKVAGWSKIKAIAAGANHTIGLREDGTVVAAGSSSYGQVNVSTWTDISAIAAGANHTIGLKADGTVVAVGANEHGQVDVSLLFTGMMPICGPVAEGGQDVTAPVTSATLIGTEGANGWYLSDVKIILSAVDNDGGTGVKEIHYSVDGTATVVQENSAAFTVAGDGQHAVSWYAVDIAGNAETPVETLIKIDTTPPAMPFLYTDPAVLWPPNHRIISVLIGGVAVDDGSGIASTSISVADEYGIYDTTLTGFGSTVPLEVWRKGSDRDGRSYTIVAVTSDQAGNQTLGTTTVVVPHDMR